MEEFVTSTQQRLQIHDKNVCTPPCPFHAPSVHKMCNWNMLWRDDRRILERICQHGVGHPDPDQLKYLRVNVNEQFAIEQSIHGCDGCCDAAFRVNNYGT